MDGYDVRFWDIKKLGNGTAARYRVRWAVDGREHCKSFKARPLADGFLDGLKDAVRDRRRPRLKQAIEARTGPVTAVRVATAGQNSPLAAIIDTAGGKVFAKGLPSGHRRVVTQAREAAVAPLVRISPRPCCGTSTRPNVLGYEYAPGRHADYTPGSPDLDRLVQLLNALSAINVPDDPGPFKRAENRWKPYVDDPAAASLFAGPALTHSDWTPDNVLVGPGRAWLIDWAWPTLGAAWTDPACWILSLMASGGHTAPEAERQAFRLPAFQAADPAHVDLFAAANVRL